jgi:hypothetical protein
MSSVLFVSNRSGVNKAEGTRKLTSEDRIGNFEMNPKMPQKSHTSGGKKGKKKSRRMSTSDQDTTQLEEEQEQQQPLSATFSDSARFEDLAANIDNIETDREVLQPRTESLVPAPQQAGDVKTTRGHVQPGPTGPPEPSGQTRGVSGTAASRQTTRGHVQPGPTGPPGPSRQTRVLSGAAAEIGEERRSSRQVQGEEKSSQERAFRPDMDDSDSDLDVQIPMYSIKDAEFCTDVGVKILIALT